MKPSRYNFFIPTRDPEKYLLYNALTTSIVLVDSSLKGSLAGPGPALTPLSEEVAQDLKRLGALVDDEVDERKIVKVRHDKAKHLVKELWFTVMTTYSCNLACDYCYQGKGELISKSMDRRTAQATVAFIQAMVQKLGVKKVSVLLYGGECLLNLDEGLLIVDEISTFAKTRGMEMRTGVVSNGTLFTDAILDQLSKYEMRYNQITLYGPRTLHDQVRKYKNGQGSFDKIIAGLERIKDSGKLKNVIIRIEVDRRNHPHHEELLNFLKARGLHTMPISFGLVMGKTQACQNYGEFCVSDLEVQQILPRLWRMAIEKGFKLLLPPPARYVFCGAQTESSFAIDSFGEIYKCTNFVGQRPHSMGNVNEFADGKSPKLRYPYYAILARDPTEFGACKECSFLPICAGGCLGLAHMKYGTYDREVCPAVKQVLDQHIKVYVEQHYHDQL